MRVVAFIPAYNEADIIDWCLKHLLMHGVTPFVLDNWSTDGTYEIARRAGVIVDRWPDAPTEYFDWLGMLQHIGFLATQAMQADWFMLNGADQFVESNIAGESFVEACRRVQREGYNAIGFDMFNYFPTDDGWDGSVSPLDYFTAYHINERSGDNVVYDAWQATPEIDVTFLGGHDPMFAGKLPYPLKFVKRHYPIRSQRHGERKVFAERMPRFKPDERAMGWHVHYDSLKPGDSFVREAV